MAEELKIQYEDPNIELVSPDQRILRLIQAESQMRDDKKLSRIIKQAELRYPDAVISLETAAQQGVNPQTLEKLLSVNGLSSRRTCLLQAKQEQAKAIARVH